ncbi:hypothetical protein ES708_17202 [subsurface metagenome]
MIILWLLGLMGLIGVIFIIVAICTHDFTKDPKTGKDVKDKIDNYLLK